MPKARIEELISSALRAQGLDAEDARDAVQEALSSFVAMAEARGLCAASFDSNAYLTAMAINVARNMRRRHHRTKTHVGVDALIDSATGADELVALREQGAAIERCISTLEEAPKRIVSLRLIEEVSGAAVAKELELSPGHVAVLLHRAKKSLTQCLTH